MRRHADSSSASDPHPLQVGPAVLAALALLLAALLLAPIRSGYATDGRDFAGRYDVTNPTDLGNGTLRITLTVRIFNYSDADVSNATVTLSGNMDSAAAYESFTGISIADKDSAVISGTLTVPAAEYNFWQNGGSPALWIAYDDASGNAVSKKVELVFAPGEGQ